MNKIILYLVGAIFLLGVLFRIFFALFFPDRYAEGASQVLFLKEREKALFRQENKKPKHYKNDKNSSVIDETKN